MECKDCKKLLSKFLDHELDPQQEALMKKHIQSCPACAQSLESINEMVRMMHNLKEVSPPDDFIGKVNEKLDQASFWEKVITGIKSFLPVTYPAKAFALAATVVLVVAVTGKLNMITVHHEGLISQDQDKGLNEAEESSSVGQSRFVMTSELAMQLKKEKAVPASVSSVEIPDPEVSIDEYDSAVPERQSEFQKDNLKQVLIIQLDDKRDLRAIEREIESQNASNINITDNRSEKIIDFDISYKNYLKLHSVLAGMGTLQKASPDIKLYDAEKPLFGSGQEVFDRIISVQLKIQK